MIYHGDCRDVLPTLRSAEAALAVTSPPYFWARDYGSDRQIGHEATVAAYVDEIAAVGAVLTQALKPDGLFYLNLADTYYSGNGQPHGSDPRSPSRDFMRSKLRPVDQGGWDLPKKSLIGIPWRVALRLQEDGWTLRSPIVWDRCNAFVEASVRDRPYRQYETVFLLARSRW